MPLSAALIRRLFGVHKKLSKKILNFCCKSVINLLEFYLHWGDSVRGIQENRICGTEKNASSEG